MRDQGLRSVIFAVVLTTVAVAALLLLPAGKRGPVADWRDAFSPVIGTTEAAEADRWRAAALKVSEDRGEPAGKQAKIEIPTQLRHYSDTRRFLATQVAESKKHDIETPRDFARLAEMIRAGQLVELETVAENYVLFGVGATADKGPFTYYDKGRGKRVPLMSEAELEAETTRLSESIKALGEEVTALRKELSSVGKAERQRRTELASQISSKEKTLKAEREMREALEFYYAGAAKRRELFSERDVIVALAGDFNGRSYDLNDERARKEMKVRMLSHLRPEALAVLEEVAASYRQKFDRPLPITSLVRPDEYQHQLSKVNSNATRIETPPHSTGLAFDVLYKYMTAEEQAHVMADLARFKDEGRIEALRENRDHFHVFAFVDGRKPGEELIRGAFGAATAKVLKSEEPALAVKKSEAKEAKAAVKAEPKKAAPKKAAVKVAQKKAEPRKSGKGGARKR